MAFPNVTKVNIKPGDSKGRDSVTLVSVHGVGNVIEHGSNGAKHNQRVYGIAMVRKYPNQL